MSGKLVVRKISKGCTEAIRVADDQQRSSSADLDAQRNLSQFITGASSEGETGTLQVCTILVERLNQEGARWDKPSLPEGHEAGVDCQTRDGPNILQIQVTRVPNSVLWKQLGQTRAVAWQRTLDQAADDLWSAVRHKEEKIPSRQRPAIILAINALDMPGLAVGAVANAFRQKYSTQVAILGFKAIWVVGPIASLSFRLDTP